MTNSLFLDGGKIGNLGDLFEILGNRWIETHPHFGKNLDALYDILSECEIEEIIIENSENLKKKLQIIKKGDQSEYDSLEEVFKDIPDLKVIYR